MDKDRTDRDRNGKESTRIPEEERRALRDNARRLTERDKPDPANTGAASREDGQEPAYRPDANVDNQKSSRHNARPGLNTSGDTATLPGAQVRKKRGKQENIDDKASQAKSDRRNG